MASFIRLPLELKQQVFWQLPTPDLGNCASTCTQLRSLLDPWLARRLKRLILADSRILRLIRPEEPKAYGITPEDKLPVDNDEIEALALWKQLRSFASDLSICPMLAKYVKHVFIDYRKLSAENPDYFDLGHDKHVRRLLRHLKLERYTDKYDNLRYWTSTCGLAAMVLLVLPNVQSLVLLGVGTYDERDQIVCGIQAALAPGCRQVRLCSLRNIYAVGCCQTHDSSHAPWELLTLPSIQSLECQDVPCRSPFDILPQKYNPDGDYFGRLAPNWDQLCCLVSLKIRMPGSVGNGLFEIFKHMPHLTRLFYQCISFPQSLDVGRHAMHVEKFGVAIETLRSSLEELVIEVEDVQNLWGIDDWDRRDDLDFAPSDCTSEEGSDETHDGTNSGFGEALVTADELTSLGTPENIEEVKTQLNWDSHGAGGIQDSPEDTFWLFREPSWDDCHPEFLGSLAGFERLRIITVPAIALHDPWPSSAHGTAIPLHLHPVRNEASLAKKDLKELLPRSLERLTLFKLGVIPNLAKAIEDVVNTSSACFPNLVSVEVKDPPSCRVTEDDEELWKLAPDPCEFGYYQSD